MYTCEDSWKRFIVLHGHGDILVETKGLKLSSKVLRSWNMHDQVSFKKDTLLFFLTILQKSLAKWVKLNYIDDFFPAYALVKSELFYFALEMHQLKAFETYFIQKKNGFFVYIEILSLRMIEWFVKK